MRMAYFELLLLFLFTISKSRCHAFEVSIHTFNHLPVLGANFTLVCTFAPQTWSRQVFWLKGNSLELAVHSCNYSYHPCESIILDNSKFALLGDNNSVNLTIYDISMDDSDTYKCIVVSSHWSEHPGSNIMQVSPLVPAPPQWLVIHDDRSTGDFNNVRVTVTAGQQYDITCESGGSRPPVALAWELPDDMTVVVGRQSDVVQDDSYVSRKVVTITPSRHDYGKSLRCVASHPELVYNQHRSIYLNVEVPSSSMLLSLSDQTSNGSLSTIFYVYENSLTSFTCRSIGSRPAAELSWALGYNDLISGNTSISVPNTLDRNLFDSESTITILIEKKHHMSRLYCFASSSIFFAMRTALLMVFATQASAGLIGTKPSASFPNGSTAILPCNYTRRTYRVYWVKENGHTRHEGDIIVQLDTSIKVGKRSGRGLDEGRFNISDDFSLVISTVMVTDEGRYSCKISDITTGLIYLNSTDVTVFVYAREPYVSIKPCEHSALGNQSEDLVETRCTYYILNNQTSFQIDCSVSGVRPNVSLNWETNGTNVGTNYALMPTFEDRGDGTFDQTLALMGRGNETINGTVFTCVAEGFAVNGTATGSVIFVKTGPEHVEPDIPDTPRNQHEAFIVVSVIVSLVLIVVVIYILRRKIVPRYESPEEGNSEEREELEERESHGTNNQPD